MSTQPELFPAPTSEDASLEATPEEVTGTQEPGEEFDAASFNPEDAISSLLGEEQHQKETVEGAEEQFVSGEQLEPDRLKDAQAMIGKQGNEIGELRKANEEMASKLAALESQLKPQEPTQHKKPYWEEILEKSDEEILKNVGSEVADPEQAKQNLIDLRGQIKLIKDILSHELSPIIEMKKGIDTNSARQQKLSAFAKDHPELESRAAAMEAKVAEVFPNGLPEGTDELVMAHVMYELVGPQSQDPAVAKQKVEALRNKNIISTRSLNGAVSSTPAPLAKQKPKLDPIQAELAREIPGLY